MQKLAKVNPRKTKAKQNHFKKTYVQIWKTIVKMLCQHRSLRAHINYVAHMQLFKNMNSYIEPCFQVDIFGTNVLSNPSFYIEFFKLRNESVRKEIHAIFLQSHKTHIEDSNLIDVLGYW